MTDESRELYRRAVAVGSLTPDEAHLANCEELLQWLWNERGEDTDAFSNIATIREATGQNFGPGDREINDIIGARLAPPSEADLVKIRRIREILGIED